MQTLRGGPAASCKKIKRWIIDARFDVHQPEHGMKEIVVAHAFGGAPFQAALIDAGRLPHRRRQPRHHRHMNLRLGSERVRHSVKVHVALAETFGLKYGIGYMFTFWFEQFNMTQVMAWITLFVAIMLILEHGVVARIEAKLFAWRPVHAL